MDIGYKLMGIFVLICLLGTGISGCLMDDIQDKVDSNVPDSVEFRSETLSYEDRIVFRYIPDNNITSTYIVSYTILEEDGLLESVNGKEFEGISSHSPIDLEVQREHSLDYQVDMLIMDGHGIPVHNDSILISSLSDEEVDLDFNRISKGYYGGQKEREFYVIDSSSEWERLWSSTDLSYDPSPLDMDFTRNMIVVVFQGEKSTGGYDIEITRIVDDGTHLQIFARESSPGPDCIVTEALTQPYDIVTIPKMDRSIEFHVDMETTEC